VKCTRAGYICDVTVVTHVTDCGVPQLDFVRTYYAVSLAILLLDFEIDVLKLLSHY
jgi:hypothetical protein